MDPRDVELVAAALQRGDVPRLGTAQAMAGMATETEVWRIPHEVTLVLSKKL